MAANVQIDTSGLVRLLNRMEGRAQPLANAECTKEAKSVVEQTQAKLPHRSGELADSLSAAPASTGAIITWAAVYAAWIEYGGSRGRARVAGGRYLGPTCAGADNRIAAAITRQLEQEARTW